MTRKENGGGGCTCGVCGGSDWLHIYKLGEVKPTSQWSFLTKIDSKDHFQFLEKLRKGCGVQKRCDELGIKTFTLKLQCRHLVSEADFPKGRIFTVDTEEQFDIVKPMLKEKHELIGK